MLIVPVLVSLFLPLTASSLQANESVTLQLKWEHAFQFAGYYAAVEKGYYNEAGLDVTLLEGGPEVHFAEELSSGRVNYSVALASMLVHRQNGYPIVALAAIMQHSPEVLLTLQSSGLNNPHVLAGKTVSVSPEDTPAILAMFKNEGLAQDAVNIVPYHFDLNNLAQGTFDAMAAYSTNEPFEFERRGIPVVMIQPRNYGVDFYGDCLYTSEKELREHPERTAAFLQASLKGWNYAMSHKEEMADIILEKYHAKRTKEALLYEAEEMEKLMFPNLIEIGHMNKGRWQHIGDTYVRLGILPENYSLEGFLYMPPGQDDHAWLRWPLAATASGCILLGALVFFLVNVNKRIKTAEKNASEAKALLRSILDTIPVAVFWKDRDSVYQGCNQYFADLAGLENPESVVGLTDSDMVWHEKQDLYLSSDREVLSKETALSSYEETSHHSNGSTHFYQKTKLPLRDGCGSKIGILGVALDITDLKKSEEKRIFLNERIQNAQKFESLYRLTGGISHHFNNIFQVILGNAELAEVMLPQQHAVRESLEKILKATRRASSIGHILLASIGQGAQRYNRINPGNFIEEILPALTGCVPETHTIRHVRNQESKAIDADPDNLKQILVNLVLNASEAMEGKAGLIEIHTGSTHCQKKDLDIPSFEENLKEGVYSYIEVSDQGEGMTEEVQQKVFDPFFSTRHKGRGLGMAAVQGIVRNHKGVITIASTPGKGSIIRLLFPAT